MDIKSLAEVNFISYVSSRDGNKTKDQLILGKFLEYIEYVGINRPSFPLYSRNTRSLGLGVIYGYIPLTRSRDMILILDGEGNRDEH